MLAPELNERVVLAYGTLLYREQLGDVLPLHAALVDQALKLREADSGIEKSNQGGWHSTGNVFAGSDAALSALASKIRSAIRYLCHVSEPASTAEWSASLFGWFNVNEHGDYAEPHHHSGNTWSGVYYVQTGSEVPTRPTSGRIEFLDPRVRCDVGPKHGFSHTGTMAVTPKDGLMLLFPSYLEHFVHPYYGEGQRITLAFNSLVQRKAPSAP